MINRRRLLALGASAALLQGLPTGISAAANDETYLGDDGLYHQTWFLDSFLELADDVAEAAGNGKRLAIMWELKGCPYCKETHFVNFARPDINAFVKEHFEILQLNILGARKVTDFDGEELSEKDIARRYGIRFTPTIQFFPKAAEGLADSKPKDREVARMAGYMKPDHFLKMFEYVQAEAYEQQSFRKYLKKI